MSEKIQPIGSIFVMLKITIMKKNFISCILIFSLLFCSNLRAQVITTIGGIGISGYSGDGGSATNAKMTNPYGVAADTVGNIFVSDETSSTIRKIAPSGLITLYAGIPDSLGYSGDGGPATNARLNGPQGLAINANGNLVVADLGNLVVRMITPSGIISTIAGKNGAAPGHYGDGGPATDAGISCSGVEFDRHGNLYLADEGTSCIRKINSMGIISTIAGIGDSSGFSGDGGPATAAKLGQPVDIAIDTAGNIYVTDLYYHNIRKITPAGIISTIAGVAGTFGSSGDNGPATAALMRVPTGITVNSRGNVFFSDADNNRVRVINTVTGVISTFAGGGTAIPGDGGAATAAKLNYPGQVAFDRYGNILVPEYNGFRVRNVTDPKLGVNTLEKASLVINLYPNPARGILTISVSYPTAIETQATLTNVAGKIVSVFPLTTNRETQLPLNLASGTYFINVVVNNEIISKKIVVE